MRPKQSINHLVATAIICSIQSIDKSTADRIYAHGGTHISHIRYIRRTSSCTDNTYANLLPVRVHKYHRIIAAISIIRQGAILLCQRVYGVPAAEDGVVEAGAVIQQVGTRLRKLLLSVITEPCCTAGRAAAPGKHPYCMPSQTPRTEHTRYRPPDDRPPAPHARCQDGLAHTAERYRPTGR